MSGSALFHVRKWVSALLTIALTLAIFPLESAHAITVSIRMAVVYDIGGRGDHGINDATAVGVDAIKKKYGLTSLSVREIVTNGTEADRENRLQFLASAKYALIIAVGSQFATALGVVSMKNPETQFALINDDSVGNLNMSDMVFSEEQGAFLAGALAGLATKSNKVGYISQSDRLPNFVQFQRGVAYTNPKAIAFNQIVEPAPTTSAQILLSEKVDVVYSTWSSTSEVQDVIAKANAIKTKVYLIGITPDQYFLLENSTQKFLLGAVSKHIDRAAYDVMTAAINNQTIIDTLDRTKGIYGHMYTINDGGLTLALTKLGATYGPRINQIISAIKSGKSKLFNLQSRTEPVHLKQSDPLQLPAGQ